jgi:hypothetical protein
MAFADDCVSVLRLARDDEHEADEQELKEKLIKLFDELIRDVQDDLRLSGKNLKDVDAFKLWLNDDYNFIPFRASVNTLGHLIDFHVSDGGKNVDKLKSFVEKMKDSETLKKFVVENANDIISRGIDNIVRPLVATRVFDIAKKLSLSTEG